MMTYRFDITKTAKVKMFTSIQRNYRGFTYKRDYETKEQFNKEMEKEQEGRNEICWALLFTDEGGQVEEYRRGYTME